MSVWKDIEDIFRKVEKYFEMMREMFRKIDEIETEIMKDVKEGISRDFFFRSRKDVVTPYYEIHKVEDEMKIIIELPGCDKSNIKIKYLPESKSIEVFGETTYPYEKKYHIKIPLREEIDENSIKATYRNGILTITMKVKKKEEFSKEIPIE